MNPILEVQSLGVAYHTQRGALQALHDVNFSVQQGDIVGIVGESGCGKSTIARSILGLLPPNGEVTSGRVLFQDTDLLAVEEKDLRQLRGREISMVFQNPMSSLNPVLTVEAQMLDIQRAHKEHFNQGRDLSFQRAISMLERVGIPDAETNIGNYPHQFSGGMRQRILIAMALMSEPPLLVADEPTSSLDVTLQAQILHLLRKLRDEFNTSILYISHDLGVIAQLCNRVFVMYAGRIVELGNVADIFMQPRHPYTRALLKSVPLRHRYKERLTTIPGLVPGLSDLPTGCKFSTRCDYTQDICLSVEPGLLPGGSTDVRCHIYAAESAYNTGGLSPTAFLSSSQSKSTPQVDDLSGAFGMEVASKQHISHIDPLITSRVEDGQQDILINVRDVSVHFKDKGNIFERLTGKVSGVVSAVDGVNLDVRRGEVIGLVGESGCGKSTIARAILGLVPLTAGEITLGGHNVSEMRGMNLRRLRAQSQMIFQHPIASLSPRMRVSRLVREPYSIHAVAAEEQETLSELLGKVGLTDEQAEKYPHELSGGQARRVGIARALALCPEFLIADEPSSGLDVSVAAGIINLLNDLHKKLKLTYIIITHDLNLVGYIADRIAVMYLGKLVEVGPSERVFDAPAHPYTRALLAAVPVPDPSVRGLDHRMLLKGELPSARTPPHGCRFHTRCPYAEERCYIDLPVLEGIEDGHSVACHFWLSIRDIQ